MLKIKELLKHMVSTINSEQNIQYFDENDFTISEVWETSNPTPIAIKQGRTVLLNGFVRMRTGATFNTTIGYVPVGCEPLYEQHFLIHGNSVNLGQLTIKTNGQIIINYFGTTSSVTPLVRANIVRLTSAYTC